MIKIADLHAVCEDRLLQSGKHADSSAGFCMLEGESMRLGIDFTDDPEKVRMWDLRSLNDISVSPCVRTECLLPVWLAYIGSMDWALEKQVEVSKKLAILVVQRLLPVLPGLPETVAKQCKEAKTLVAAEAAAAREAARAAEAREAARAAEASARTAWAAEASARTAWAAAWGAAEVWEAARAAEVWEAARVMAWVIESEKIFRLACRIFLEAAQTNEPESKS